MTATTDDSEMRRLVIQGNVEALQQLQGLLQCIDDQRYAEPPPHYLPSAMGQHTRHVLDIYRALLNGLQWEQNLVDYDVRCRGADIEISRPLALQSIAQLIQQLQSLKNSRAWLSLQISTEVALSSTHTVRVRSNLARELVFTASHTIHHLALMVPIAKFFGVAIPESLGMAPATATFLRDATKA